MASEEERQEHFKTVYWETCIQLSSLITDLKRSEMLSRAKRARLPKKDIKELENNLKWKGASKRFKEYNSGERILISLATLEDIDTLSSYYGVLLTRIKFDDENFKAVKPEKVKIERKKFKKEVLKIGNGLKKDFVEACDDPGVKPEVLLPIAEKWYQSFLYFLKIFNEISNIYGEENITEENEQKIWYFAEKCLGISEIFVVFYNRYHQLIISDFEAEFFDLNPSKINIKL